MQHALVCPAVTKEGHGYSSQVAQFGSQGRADGQRDAGSDHPVGTQHSLAHISYVHRPTLPFVGSGGPTEQFGHHELRVDALGDTMAMAAVGAANVIINTQVGTYSVGTASWPADEWTEPDMPR